MSFLTRLFLYAALCCFPLVAPAQEMRTGQGVVCDTPAQLEAVIRHERINVHTAIAEVNAGTNACGYLTIAFIKGEKVGEVPVQSGIYDLLEITILGVHEGSWRVVHPTKQFTAIFRKGERI